jgi:hypothetical protein
MTWRLWTAAQRRRSKRLLFLALVPAGANHLGVSSVNFPVAAQGTGVANSFIVGLSSDGKVDVYTGNCSSYTVNIIMDITGYVI